MDALRVLVVEDESREAALLEDYLASLQDFQPAGIADGQARALSMVVERSPDIVLLDLRLRQGDGTGFLSDLEALHLAYKPFILVVSRLLTLATQTTVCGLGADYCVSKDNIDCSPRGVVGLLRNFEPFIRSHTAVDLQVNEHPITPQLQEKQLRRLMALTLARISIPTGDLVNRELVEAMFFVLPILEKDLPLPDLKNTVYPLIAEKYEIKDPRSIERGIRNILEKVWDRTEKTLLKNYYDFPVSKDTGYPSPREFIFNFAYANFTSLPREKAPIVAIENVAK